MQATTMRLKPELIESLKVEAKKDDRSLNNLINKVLSCYVSDAQKAKLAVK
jgi:predicted HicB family RNase H-like nuclease